jgi:hypothetical protein
MTTPRDTVDGVVALMQQRVEEVGRLQAAAQSFQNITESLLGEAQTDLATLQGIDWGTVNPAPRPDPGPDPQPTSLRASGYNTGNGDTAIDDADKVAAWRNQPLGAYSVFNWGHRGKDEFLASYTKPGWTPYRAIPILSHRGVMPVCTIPGAVEDAKDMQAIANGALDDMHRGCARWLASQPWRTDVALRISRECNDAGQPFYYGATPAARAVWRKAHVRIFGIYAQEIGDRAKFVFCIMKRTDEKEWTQAIPLDDFPRDKLILSVDAYLNKPYDDTPAGYAEHTMKFLDPKLAWAEDKGVKVAFSEWAVTAVDQPGNIRRHLDTFEGLRKAGRLHHEHYFGSTDQHAIFGKTKLPKSAAAYAEWFKGR